jgi:integrase
MPSKIRYRGNHAYQLFVPNGYDTTGKQQGFTKTVIADNPTEAKTLYDLFLSECLQGKVLASATEKMTLSQFYDYWKEKFAIPRYAKTTMVSYNQVFIRINIALGHLRIDKIKPIQMVDFFAQLSKPDATANNTPFAERSIGKYRELLQLLFSSALKWELITSSPMEKLDKPRTRKKHKAMPTHDEFITFFECISKAPLKNQLMCMLAFAGGLPCTPFDRQYKRIVY